MSNKENNQQRGLNHSDRIGQVFDEMSDQYTDIMDHMVPHYRKLIATMFDHLPADFKPERILELGCGNGNVSAQSTALFPDAKHHLVDASDEMIQLCKERFADLSITYEQNLFQNLQLPPDTYDLVIAGFSLHHLEAEEKAEFFVKLCPAMTSTGIFTCADLFVNKDSEEHDQLLEDWKAFLYNSGRTRDDWDWLVDHYNKYDRPSAYSDQQNWLSRAGFTNVELSWSDGHWGCYHALRGKSLTH